MPKQCLHQYGCTTTIALPIQSKTVSVVVVTHNPGEYLLRCLESIFRSEYPFKELIIVDNASNDGSLEKVRNTFPKVKIILNRINLGYARAANIGMKTASGTFVVLINPDTIVEKTWLTKLVKAAERHPRSAFFQPKIMLLNKPGYINSAGNMIHIGGFGICRGLEEYDRGQFDSEEEVSFASGACVLVRSGALREIGVCDELFFMYMDDLDWSWRGKMFGWESTYVPSSMIHHEWGKALEVPSEKFYYLELGRLIALIKNLTFRSLIVLSPILVFCEVAVIVNAILNKWLPEKIRSYAYLLELLNEIKKKRRELTARRRVMDRVILKDFVTELKHPYVGVAGIGLGRVCRTLFRFLWAML